MKLLIIEDEKELSNNIVTYLSSENYVCEQAFTYEEAQIKLDLYDYDCVLLDLMLPGGNGLDILRDIRRRHNPAGVIIVSAKDSLDDKVKGLEIGADDYLPKPFALAEVAARLKALGRRHNNHLEPVINLGRISYNPASKVVTKDGEPVSLSPKELLLLELLIVNRNKVLSKESIENKLYSWEDEVQSNAVEVHVHHLRKKFGKGIVKTINKIGYTLGEI